MSSNRCRHYYHFTSNEKFDFLLDYLSRPLPESYRTFESRFKAILATCDWFLRANG